MIIDFPFVLQDGRFTDASDVVIQVQDLQDAPPTWVLLPTQLTHNDGTPAVSLTELLNCLCGCHHVFNDIP